MNKLQSVHMPNMFVVYTVNIGEVNDSRFAKFANFSPAKIFPFTIFQALFVNKQSLLAKMYIVIDVQRSYAALLTWSNYSDTMSSSKCKEIHQLLICRINNRLYI